MKVHARDLGKTWCGRKYFTWNPNNFKAVYVGVTPRSRRMVTCKICLRALKAMRAKARAACTSDVSQLNNDNRAKK